MIFNVEYYHAPPREIDQAINWLHGVIADCELKIQKLESLKKHDERMERYTKNMNDLSDMFDDPDFFTIDYQNQVEIIRQRLGCDHVRAHHIHEHLRLKKVRRDRKARHREVIDLYRAKVRPTEIAKRTGLSRQSVYTIINKAKSDTIF